MRRSIEIEDIELDGSDDHNNIIPFVCLNSGILGQCVIESILSVGHGCFFAAPQYHFTENAYFFGFSMLLIA